MLDICRIEQAVKFIQNDEYEYVLSLVDKGTKFTKKNEKHIVIEIDDIPYSGEAVPQNFIPFIVEWSKKIPDNSKVLIHCHMGISRSPAVGIAFLISRGMSTQDAVDEIFNIRPLACPNIKICKKIEEYFKIEGEISKSILKHYNKKPFGKIII